MEHIVAVFYSRLIKMLTYVVWIFIHDLFIHHIYNQRLFTFSVTSSVLGAGNTQMNETAIMGYSGRRSDLENLSVLLFLEYVH